jgi:hypothetical protein
MDKEHVGFQSKEIDARVSSSANVRKPYQRPVLVAMGTVRELTMSNNPGSSKDGMPNKTGRGGGYGASSTAS